MPFEFVPLEIRGLILIRPKTFRDDRGFFLETYKQSDFAAAGIAEAFVQDNLSKSANGVIRGLHCQKDPMAQGKLVVCLQGAIFDVAVDIRKGSPWFGKHAAVELSGENGQILYVPPGFAHGFAALGTAVVLYKCTKEYSPQDDRGVIWNDPDLGIRWPVDKPILSEKDRKLPFLRDADTTFLYQDIP